MKANITRTETREYYTWNCGPVFRADWKPINTKTGKAWQASRELQKGFDACVQTERGKYIGYSTEAKAIEAIAAEMKRSGK